MTREVGQGLSPSINVVKQKTSPEAVSSQLRWQRDWARQNPADWPRLAVTETPFVVHKRYFAV